MGFVNCFKPLEMSEQMEIRSILSPLRYVPRFFGLTPYSVRNRGIEFSKFARVYASFYVILYVALYCTVISLDAPVSTSIPVLYWPRLFSIVSCFCGCVLSVFRNGFEQYHAIDLVKILFEFDQTTRYDVSRSWTRDSRGLSLISWTTPCLAIVYSIVESLALISYEETVHLSTILAIFYSASFLVELTTFVIYALLVGVRLLYLNEQVQGKISLGENGNWSSMGPENFRAAYSTLLKAADLLIKHYNLQFLCWLFHLSTFVICRLFVILCLSNSTIRSLHNVLILLIYLGTATIFMAASQFVGYQANRTAIILLRRNIEESFNIPKDRKEYFELSLCMALEPYSINAMGFFDVDIGICNTIFVLGVMFVPILATASQK